MIVLGLTAYAHDSAACVVRDGEVVALVEEERLSRRKHDGRFPRRAIASALAIAGLEPRHVERVAFFLRPDLVRRRILRTARDEFPRAIFDFARKAQEHVATTARLPRDLARAGLSRARLVTVEHHLAHAASAFFPSPFERAAVLTVDGKGEETATALGAGDGASVRLSEEILFPHSLGYLYAIVTKHLGFAPWGGEGKVMGLAAYGAPNFRDAFDRLLRVRRDGGYSLDLSAFAFQHGGPWTTDALVRLLGPARERDAPIEQRHADVARSLQDALEDAVLALARRLRERSGLDALCCAGGVFMNSSLNGKLLRNGPFSRVFFQPLAGDQGCALGAALVVAADAGEHVRRPLATLQLGPSFDDDDVARALERAERAGARLTATTHARSDVAAAVARSIARGEVVGFVSGRMEAGARALGGRSILACPRRADMRDRLNIRVKKRETFRPFAPSVLEERAADWFEPAVRSPFMMAVVPARPERRGEVPAALHVDGTGRVQTLERSASPSFYDVVAEHELISGVPLVVNTSFNLRGEPIVCSPDDALATFCATEIDRLFLERTEVARC